MGNVTGFSFRPRQFLLGGLALGAAEAVYYLVNNARIDISFAVAEAAATVEKVLGIGHVFSKGFTAEVNPVFAGLIAGSLLVALATLRKRHRVRYPLLVLATAFVGGLLTGFGAVLAGGDTLYHFVGGVALLQTSSLFMAMFAIPFVFLAVEMLTVLGLTRSFRVDEQTEKSPAGGQAQPSASGRNSSDHLPAAKTRLVIPGIITLVILAVLFLLNHQENIFSVALVVGIIAGAGLAASGFGVEWSLLVPDSLSSSPRYLRKLGFPEETVLSLRSFLPLAAWLLAILILSLTAMVVAVAGGMSAETLAPLSEGAPFHIGHVAGAPLLAVGSVLMIGCDFRNYARLGLGFTTAVAAVPGLLLGFLPAALLRQQISSWTETNVISQTAWLPDLISHDAAVRAGVWSCFLLFLVLCLALGSRRFQKNT